MTKLHTIMLDNFPLIQSDFKTQPNNVTKHQLEYPVKKKTKNKQTNKQTNKQKLEKGLTYFLKCVFYLFDKKILHCIGPLRPIQTERKKTVYKCCCFVLFFYLQVIFHIVTPFSWCHKGEMGI